MLISFTKIYVLLTPIQDFLETKFNTLKKKKWQCDLPFLASITSVHVNDLNLKFLGKEKLICDPPRPVQEFAGIKNSILQINNSDFYIFFLLSINMQKIVIVIDRIMYFGCKKCKKNLKNILLLLVNLELLFSLHHTTLKPLLILS